MTQDEMVAQLKKEVKGLTSYLTDPTDYDNACDDAERETGWSFPTSDAYTILWLKKRAVRYLIFYLATESAHKFKVKQFNLNQKFDHHMKLVNFLDKEFADEIEKRPEKFAGVDAYKIFGTKVDAGFAYDPVTGADRTYDSDQEVIAEPEA